MLQQDSVIRSTKKSISVLEVCVALLLVAIACTIRAWRLSEYPFFLHNDEMSCGLAAQEYLRGGYEHFFGIGWAAHPVLGFALIAQFLKIFGNDLIGLRMSAVVLGTISIIGAYIFVRMFWGRYCALVVAALTVCFHLHLHYSRIGTHYISAATFISLSAAGFALAVKFNRVWLYAVTGVLCGLSTYMYAAGQIAPILIASWGLIVLIHGIHARKQFFLRMMLLGLMCLLVIAPQIPVYIKNPTRFFERSQTLSVFNPSNLPHLQSVYQTTDTFEIAREQIRRSFGMYFIQEDRAGQYGYSKGVFDQVTKYFAVLGFIVLICSLNQLRSQLLFAMYILVPLLGGLFFIDPPSSPKFASISAFMMMAPALGLFTITRRVGRPLRLAITVVFVVSSAYLNLRYYFGEYVVVAPQYPRDEWAHLLLEHPQIRTLVVTDIEGDDFNFESFRFLTPQVQNVWLPRDRVSKEIFEKIVQNLPKPILVVTLSPECFPDRYSCIHRSSDSPRRNSWYYIIEK